jgi:hypothetical protein
MARLLRFSVVLILTLVPLIALAAPQTVLILNSQPGDYIGQGLQQTFTPADGSFTVTSSDRGIQVSFNNANFSQYWYLGFTQVSGHKFLIGEYEGAQSYFLHSPTHPGLTVFGDSRGCNTSIGRFQVSDIAFNLDGSIARLAVDFEQHCEGASPALYGSIRYSSASKLVARVGIGSTYTLKGNAGKSDASVMLSLSMPSSTPATVQYMTADNTALAGADYVATSGTVTFPAGTTAVPITIPIIGDRLARGTKLFKVLLSSPIGVVFGVKSTSVKILDPNGALTVLSMYGQPGDSISPGQLLLTTEDGAFNRSRNPYNGVTVLIQTDDLRNASFAAPNNVTLTKGAYPNAQSYPFEAPGTPGLNINGAGRGCTASGSFNVLQAGYDTAGNVRSFAVDFEQHCDGAAAGLFGSLRLNSKWRQISLTNAVVDPAQGTATFTVTLNPSSATAVSVQFSTTDGTAISGVDYAGLSEQVTFSPGETEKTVVVRLLSPTAGNKFYGQLSAPSGAPLWISQGSATF